MKKYDVAVVGGGPAGCMAAIKAAKSGAKVILLERNHNLGRKLLLTGNGRCNLTNNSSIGMHINKWGKQGQFYRDALNEFGPDELMNFFQTYIPLKTEKEGRVFPEDDNAKSVLNVLEKYLILNRVKLYKNFRLKHLNPQKEEFSLESHGKDVLKSRCVILSTGGKTYPQTGSTGDGLEIAQELGHKLEKISAGLVGLKSDSTWIKDCQGLILKNVTLKFYYQGKWRMHLIGDVLLTHFGLSGPLILDISHELAGLIDKYGELRVNIDLLTSHSFESLEQQFISDFQDQGRKMVGNYLKFYIPDRMVPIILKKSNINPDKRLNQLNRQDRQLLVKILKSLPLSLNGYMPLETAMVTCGGISLRDVNPKDMQSKIVERLFFAGEILDGCSTSGGFNLQQAFSTGYLAGWGAANYKKNRDNY